MSLAAVAFAALLGSAQIARAALAKAAVLETNVAYLRVTQTGKDLPEQISTALDALQATNTLAGIVLDLRFAGAGDAEDLKPAENVLEGTKLPLAILVNAQTRNGAVQLAEDLRAADAALIFGAAVDHLQPDIPVSVSAQDEAQFLKNPYGTLPPDGASADGNTNLLPYVDIDHTTEADLVRDKIKDGDQDSGLQPAPDDAAQTPKPFIRDPVLARGVDFIKGVAALHLSRNQ
jgi:hypothetical protein